MTSWRFPVVARLLAMATVLACGGGGAGDDGDGSATEGTATESNDATMSTASADDTMGDSASSGSGEEECGNGVVEGFEQCDDGPANSNTMPNACRTDCRAPRCGDGVVDDATEECDDGPDNGDLTPNACRTTCVAPICGDGVPDMGEPCDDGNEEWGDSCFECASLYYFVLNAPDDGPDSIVRASRDGGTVRIVDAAEYDGMLQLALEPEGTTLYALQSGGGVHRVLFFDPSTGSLTAEADLGAGVLGYEPTPRALALAGDGVLYVALEGMGSTRLIAVDTATQVAMEVADLGAVNVADMTAAGADALFVTTGPDDSVVRIALPAFTTSTFASSLSTPIAITYDESTELLWIVNNPGGTADIVQADLAGTVMPFNPVAGYTAPMIHGVAIDAGMVVLATVKSADVVVSIAILGGVLEFFTDMIEAPTDLEIVDLQR
ncbi:MAG TPA: DUF4215 domain-containing protein [Nannocystaceae bacterium]|nr:DUF4215 domain-containing protein [Nannocystaceae bacterium]